ncbi:MAG: type 4a pilus biogenesis protein PilO [Methylomonas sp.]
MNLAEIDWDLRAAGGWPKPIKFSVITFVVVFVSVIGAYYQIMPKRNQLTEFENQLLSLKTVFEIKQKKAANLHDYQEQLVQLELMLSQALKQMPNRAEVAGLLADISQVGAVNGLVFKLFQPNPEVYKTFYWELPIHIQVLGQYQQLANFVSDLAEMSRLVTLHDVNIVPIGSQNKERVMLMSAVIRTYYEAKP